VFVTIAGSASAHGPVGANREQPYVQPALKIRRYVGTRSASAERPAYFHALRVSQSDMTDYGFK